MKITDDECTIAFEGIEDSALAAFLRRNWGLAIHIRSKLKIKCSNMDLLWFSIDAYDRAQKYMETRNRDKGSTTSRYHVNHHWGQELKSILVAEKRRDMCELSYEELIETNPAVLSKERINTNREIPQQEKLELILKIAESQKIAENIAILSRHGYKEEYIATELNLPLEKVASVISLMEQIRDV